jgi:hypothetical protein
MVFHVVPYASWADHALLSDRRNYANASKNQPAERLGSRNREAIDPPRLAIELRDVTGALLSRATASDAGRT